MPDKEGHQTHFTVPEMPWKKGLLNGNATEKINDHPLTEAELRQAIVNADKYARNFAFGFRLMSKKEYEREKRKLWLKEIIQRIRQLISRKFS